MTGGSTGGRRPARTPDGRRIVPPPQPEPATPGHGELVLIVEDEPEFRELVELWVGRHGWRTATAADGLEVMRKFEEEEPDLVLLDLNLPGMDGWEVTEWIRRVSTVPVLMVTAMGSEADVVRGLVTGADDYLTKPIRMPELVARIAAALRRVRLAGGRPREDEPIEHRACVSSRRRTGSSARSPRSTSPRRSSGSWSRSRATRGCCAAMRSSCAASGDPRTARRRSSCA